MHHAAYFYLEMHTHELTVPYTNKPRRIRVLLPKDYQKNENKSYPVLYFHDGQNVFYSRESFSGHSWKIIPAIKKNPDIPQMIVVGIDNDNENRLNEYSPWPFTNTPVPEGIRLGGKGLNYADFVMNVVKPFIDSHYRTKPDKRHTAMAGSSLGGNITQFMGLEYADQIGNLGVFSSASWLTVEAFNRYISRQKLDPSQRIFIQVGTQEGDETDRDLTHGNMKQIYINASLSYYQQLLAGGMPQDRLQLIIAADATHSEEAWATYLPDCLRFLSEEW